MAKRTHDDLEGLRGTERKQLLRQLYCLHSAIPWRSLKPVRKTLTAVCPDCGARISRSAFTK